MMKAVAHLSDNKTLIVLGMSSANVRELKRDNPIIFNLASIGLPNRKYEIERLRWMIAYAAKAPTLASAADVLMDALDGVAGAEGKATQHA